MRILALESSCDETAAAVIENGRRMLSNVVFSQIDLHALYGGVVPEIASRAHVEACDRVVDQALAQAGIKLYPGVTGEADQAVAALMAGTLSYNPDTVCAHHDDHHGPHQGDCASHHCGGHCAQ